MNTNDAQYNISITFVDINFSAHEINNLAFIRTPLKHNASFCILNLDLYIIQQQMINDILIAKIKPKITITITTIDLSTQVSTRRYKDNKIIFKKTYSILKMSDLPFNIIESISNVTFYCVDELLHYLSGINTFNDNLLKIKGIDALYKYENYLTTRYGDNFNYREVNIDNEHINNFVFNQILLQSKSDIIIPNELLENYNIMHSFCLYFFDDFSMSEENNKLIDVVFINLRDIENYKRINIFDSKLKFSQIVNISSINDERNPLSHLTGQHISSNNTTGDFYQDKNTGKVDAIQVKNKSQDVKLLFDKRDINAVNSTEIDYIKDKAVGNLHINSKFDYETSTKNFNYLVDQYRNQLDKIITINSSNTIPSELQFGYSYNFEFNLGESSVSSGAKYSYTPISIINIFQKESVQSQYCIHNSKSQLLKISDPK